MAKKPPSPKTPSGGSTPKSPGGSSSSEFPGGSSPLSGSLRGRVPIGTDANLSKGDKAKGVIKGAADGARGKNAAGAAAGGQVTGALAGAAQAIVKQTKGRTLVALWVGATFGPFLAFFVAFMVISSFIGNAVTSTVAGADQATVASSGASVSALVAMQNASLYHSVPWEVLAATAYYETGVGQSVAQQRGVCPQSAPAGAVCPATLDLPPGSLTSGGTGTSPQGTAPAAGPTSGFNPSVGRNGTVPTYLPPSSPDWTTTNTADWDCIRQAESGDNYTATAGAYGILASTWASLGLLGTPGQASKSQQNSVALEILNYEGHFYGAWNDLCTQPGVGPQGHIAYVSPGTPGSGGNAALSIGGSGLPGFSASACPYVVIKHQPPPPHYYGPYCERSGVAPTSTLNDVAAASGLFATQIDASLANAPGGDSIDLTAGVSTAHSGLPVVDNASDTATTNHSDIVQALATLPIQHNSSALDENIYELALSWANGYSPTSPTTCSSSGTSAAATTIHGPGSSNDLLSPAQVTLSNDIISQAASDGASQTTQIAAVAGALATTNLTGKSGIFGDGVVSISSALRTFTQLNANSTATPDAQAGLALHATSSTFTGWIAGATQLVDATSSAVSACGANVPLVPGGSSKARAAVVVAKTVIGDPYVWGGGDSSGPSGSAVAPPSQVGQPGFDCSGLVQYAFASAGVSLPRTAQEQYDFVAQHSVVTSDVSQLQPGDLLFFSDNEPGINHVAIYLGDGNLIQAPETGSDVSYGTLSADMGLGFVGGGPAA